MLIRHPQTSTENIETEFILEWKNRNNKKQVDAHHHGAHPTHYSHIPILIVVAATRRKHRRQTSPHNFFGFSRHEMRRSVKKRRSKFVRLPNLSYTVLRAPGY